ncbi:MAG: ATP-dependent DNA helicase RecG, partial [Patescibacteria group bacterium]
MKLTDPVYELPYVGQTYGTRLKKLGVETVKDLLYHFPFRYQDFSHQVKIKNLWVGQEVSLQGEILEVTSLRTKTGKFLTKARIKDESGEVAAVWFNQSYLNRTLKEGNRVGLAGRVASFNGQPTLMSPEFEILRGREALHTAGLVPVYPETARLSSKWLRSRLRPLLADPALFSPDSLPASLLKKYQFPDLPTALQQIHFPRTQAEAFKARQRFAFEELFTFNLRALVRKKKWQEQQTPVKIERERFSPEIAEFIKNLPFKLTKAQNRVLEEVFADLEKAVPMNRLLEGDVGSGKTVIAAAAAYLTYLNGARSVLMAPTEVLADQHFQTLKKLLSPYGVKIALHTGSRREKEADEFDLWVGTHALFYKKGTFGKVGLVVIDEQHRFGVRQRAELLKKTQAGKMPHILTLTATPIPRTLALAVYGDLDLSLLDELPPGRIPVKTHVVPPQKREKGYLWLGKNLQENKSQAFVICPLIEESEAESLKQVKAATSVFQNLKEILPQLEISLLHGRLKGAEKEKILQDFRNGKKQILVSTPVVEVGIDVPNATVMMVEGAERFGLASLHQLRGRVGRGEKESFCFLLTESEDPKVLERLQALEKEKSGFALAELDLTLRGPGEIYGTAQHGLSEL